MPPREQRTKPNDDRHIEYRAADADLDTQDGVISGYLTAWWAVDSYGTAFAPSAFTRTLQDRADKLFLLYQHDPSAAIGKLSNIVADDYGLKHSSQIIDDGDAGTVTLKRLRGGVPFSHSHGFRTLEERPATEDDPLIFTDSTPEYIRRDPTNAYVITQVRAYEGSVVTFPALDLAAITSVRSDMELQALAQTLDALKAGHLTPAHRSIIVELTAAWQAAPELHPQPPRTAAEAREDREAALATLLASSGLTIEDILSAA